MERLRWLPEQTENKRIVANIPAYNLYVYEGNDEVLNMDIVVGKAGTRTVIFSDQLKYVVFSPYWNVPASIVRNEILPAMRKNSRYLSRQNMEIT
ncbi:MAG: L,D-transpeptidase family protein, partial [Chitinophagaceae bacterium]|nr:L,D-transpeptidase family protein [Chitinophagaceae bacterium]